MGGRNRSAEKKSLFEKKKKLAIALKELTRAKAEKELNNGADPTDIRFVAHRNYHIRFRAWHLNGRQMPEDEKELYTLFETLAKGRTVTGVAQMKELLGIPDKKPEEQKVA